MRSVRIPPSLRIRAFAALCLAASAALIAGCPETNDDGPIIVINQDSGRRPGPMTGEEILAAAKVRNELHWYTSAPEKAAEDFLAAFREKYPFITTRLRRASTFDTKSRINDEVNRGSVEADVVHILDVGAFIDLRRDGALLYYETPEESQIRENLRLPGYWWAMRLVALGIAYNPETLSPGEAPRTWEDLLDPRFKGRIGLKDAVTAGTAYAQYYLLRERLGTIFWERMGEQRPRISRSADEVKAQLLNGEILVAGEMAGYNMLEAREAGEPIAGIWPEEGVPLIPGPIAILAHAPHPEAAMLFVDFALSKEGQERFRDLLGAYSARVDIDPLPGQPPLDSLNLLTPTAGWQDYADRQTDLHAEFGNIFRPGGE